MPGEITFKRKNNNEALKFTKQVYKPSVPYFIRQKHDIANNSWRFLNRLKKKKKFKSTISRAYMYCEIYELRLNTNFLKI